jgi:hypothetical protein
MQPKQLEALARGRQTVIENNRKHQQERQDKFLESFLSKSMAEAAKDAGVEYMTVARDWVLKDEEFRKVYYEIRAAKDIIKQENLEEYIYNLGIGSQKTGKEVGIGMPNVVAALAHLKAVDKDRWSEKLQTESKQTIEITNIHYSLTPGRRLIPADEIEGEVRELPSGV